MSADPPARTPSVPAPTAVLAAAVGLFAVAYVARLWPLTHYQFAPVAVAAAGYIGLVRWRTPPRPQPGDARGVAVLLAAAWAGFAAGVGAHTKTGLGGGLIAGYLAGLYAAGGGALVWRAWAGVALVGLCVPPPAGVDARLVTWLRELTTVLGSDLLDLVGVSHLREGNVLRVSGRSLFVEDACSGVNSLFSTLACILGYAGLTGRGPIRTGLLVAVAVGWVVLANTLRVVIVAAAAGRGVDLATGWSHEAVGFATYLLALAVTWCVDQVWAFAAGPPAAPAAAGGPGWPPVGAVGWGPAAAFAGLAVAYLGLYPGDFRPNALLGPAGTARVLAAADMARGDLPEGGAGWRVTDFRTDHRELQDLFGEHSRVWVASAADAPAVAAVDYPFDGWHALERCYRDQGWDAGGPPTPLTVDGTDARPRELTFGSPTGLGGYLIYALVSADGRPLEPFQPPPLWRRPGTPVGLLTGAGWGESGRPSAGCQVQVFVQSPGGPSPAARQAARDLFATLYNRVRDRLAADTPARPPEPPK